MTSVENQNLPESGRQLGKYKTPKEPEEVSLEYKTALTAIFKNQTKTPAIHSVSQIPVIFFCPGVFYVFKSVLIKFNFPLQNIYFLWKQNKLAAAHYRVPISRIPGVLGLAETSVTSANL